MPSLPLQLAISLRFFFHESCACVALSDNKATRIIFNLSFLLYLFTVLFRFSLPILRCRRGLICIFCHRRCKFMVHRKAYREALWSSAAVKLSLSRPINSIRTCDPSPAQHPHISPSLPLQPNFVLYWDVYKFPDCLRIWRDYSPRINNNNFRDKTPRKVNTRARKKKCAWTKSSRWKRETKTVKSDAFISSLRLPENKHPKTIYLMMVLVEHEICSVINLFLVLRRCFGMAHRQNSFRM